MTIKEKIISNLTRLSTGAMTAVKDYAKALYENLVVGQNFLGNEIHQVQSALSSKQNTLTAGQNIVINNDTISAVLDAGFDIEIVESLPTTGEVNTIYFVPASGGTAPNVYDEYMYINNSWEVIGTTQVDLSNYYNKTETDTLLAGKQGTLTAGSNISINNNTISATDTTYSASDNIEIINNAIKAVGYRYDTTNGAFAEGDRDIVDSGTTYPKSTATGRMAHAEGCETTASGFYSHTEGRYCTASGSFTHSEGNTTRAIGSASHAEGANTNSNGIQSHTEGYNTETGGNYSSDSTNPKTVGAQTDVGAYSHAEGNSTIAYGYDSHAEGRKTFAKGSQSHAEGSSTNALGIAAHSEGGGTNADAVAAHAEGRLSKVNSVCYAGHAEGYNTEVGGNYTSNTKTAGTETGAGAYAHAEGNATIANGVAAHSEGVKTLAKGNASHAEGNNTTANGNQSHSEGYNTITNNSTEHAQGSLNISHINSTFGSANATQHSIGIGASNTRKNAVEIMQNGDAYLLGVGNYDGVHIPSETGYSYIQSLQAVIDDLQFKVIMLEPCPITMLKYKATSDMSQQIEQYIPNYSYGDYRSPEGFASFSSDLTVIPANAFSDVTDLTKVEIPEGVTDIEPQAFKGCSSLQEVILPRSLTLIDDEAFYDCSSIYAIRYNGTTDDWGNIAIGSDVFAGTSITQIICIDGFVNI